MFPDRVSNPGPLTYESGALPIALRGPAYTQAEILVAQWVKRVGVHVQIPYRWNFCQL